MPYSAGKEHHLGHKSVEYVYPVVPRDTLVHDSGVSMPAPVIICDVAILSFSISFYYFPASSPAFPKVETID